MIAQSIAFYIQKTRLESKQMKELLLCVAIALIFIAIANTKTFKTTHTNGQGKAKTTAELSSDSLYNLSLQQKGDR
jgi:hypothetical protein